MNSLNKPVLKIYSVSSTILSFEDLAVNEVKNDIPPSELTFCLVGKKTIHKKTNKYVIECLTMKKNQAKE